MTIAVSTDLIGWHLWKDGEPYGVTRLTKTWHEQFESSAHGLTPNQSGLREAERILREKHGWEAHPTRIAMVDEDQPYTCLGPVLRGTVCEPALAWSHWSKDRPERSRISLASFLATCIQDLREGRTRYDWQSMFPEIADWPDAHWQALSFYGWLLRKRGSGDMLPQDSRRARTLAKHRAVALELMASVQLDLAPLQYLQLPDDALPKDDEEWEQCPGFQPQLARRSRDYQWYFMECCQARGTMWFTPWNQSRREEKGPDEWRDALLSGMDIMRWWSDHPDWFVVGEWDNERDARPVQLTDAGREALAHREQYDLEPYNGGMVEPGWTAVPAPPELMERFCGRSFKGSPQLGHRGIRWQI